MNRVPTKNNNNVNNLTPYVVFIQCRVRNTNALFMFLVFLYYFAKLFTLNGYISHSRRTNN